MVGVMSHAEASELLGAFALDAVDADEAAAVEAHLEVCPRCRDELRSHREVVGLLAYAGQEAPEGLWDRVVAGINDSGEATPSYDVEAPHGLKLVRVDTAGDSSAVVHRSDAGPDGSRRSRRWSGFNRVAGLVAAAAVVVVALMGVEVARLQGRTDHLQGQISAMAASPTMVAVDQALAVPGAQRVALKPLNGGTDRLEAVILPGGQGYLYHSELAPLSAAHTYQLWGVVGDQRISYGVLGSAPGRVVPFRASSGVQALAVTAEVAGGVVTSTQRPVAVGFVS